MSYDPTQPQQPQGQYPPQYGNVPQQPYQGQPYPPQGPVRSVSKERGLSGKSHMFHLMMTIVTCSLWGWFVWLPLWVYRMIVRRKKVTKYHYE